MAEQAALEAEAEFRDNLGKRNPRLRELKAKALALRAEADRLMAEVIRPGDEASATSALPEVFLALVAAWRRAEHRAEQAEAQLVDAFARYVAHAGPLPPLQLETDVAMLRAESTSRLEQIYAEAKRLRMPSTEEFRNSAPASIR